MALGLLAAQAVGFVLLVRAEDRAAVLRAASAAASMIETAAGADEPRGFAGRRRARFAERRVRRTDAPQADDAQAAGRRMRRAERVVTEELTARGVPVRAARVAAVTDAGPRGLRDGVVVSVLTEEGASGGAWLNARAPLPRRRPARLVPLAVQTLITYLALLAPVLWIGRQVARPLEALTRKTARYRPGGPPDAAPPEGPEDIANLARAIAAMQARIADDLAERDAMLGAIGHDLRTPLTSLRLRTEQVADEGLRAKMIATLARTEALLDDTLALARSGQPAGELETTDMAAFAQAESEAARAAGLRVTLGETDAVPAPIHRAALSRAVQNLIKNADRYAGGGTLSVRQEGDRVVIAVTDEGPGLPEGFEPGSAFARGEGSRNRATGGAGLGLAIARRVAEAHGGALALTPRPGGGTVAAISVPVAGA